MVLSECVNFESVHFKLLNFKLKPLAVVPTTVLQVLESSGFKKYYVVA